MSTCTCFMVDPKYWTTHYGAVDPGSMYEPNPECPEHFPDQHEHEEWQIAPSAKGGMYCTECGRKVNVGPGGITKPPLEHYEVEEVATAIAKRQQQWDHRRDYS